MRDKRKTGLGPAGGVASRVLQDVLDRCARVGGEPPPPEVLRKMRDELGIQIPTAFLPIAGQETKEGK